MGGGQDSTNSKQLDSWEESQESESDSEVLEDSNGYDNLVLVDSQGRVSTERDPGGEEEEAEDEMQETMALCLTLATPAGDERNSPQSELCLTSAAPPSDERVSPQSELRRRILQKGEALATRDNIRQTRGKLNRYTPGSSILFAEGKKGRDNVIPEMTSLLIVGLKGAGKSTLINNVIRVLRNKPSGFYRARVSDDPSENGTYFMGEHMVCSGSGRPRVSLFDTRGLSLDDTTENAALIEGWMKDGVRHGQMDLRASDNSYTKDSIEKRGRHGDHQLSKKRDVNFVIFVIDGFSVFKMKESGDESKLDKLVQLYKNPYLTFKDDRPVVVMTHGDKLSHDDRISTQIYLGEILGVPPVEQIFDISGTTTNEVTSVEARHAKDIAVLDMLNSSLDCADRNLPYKKSSVTSLKEVFKAIITNFGGLDQEQKVALIGMIICVYVLLILLVIACVSLSLSFKRRRKAWWHRCSVW